MSTKVKHLIPRATVAALAGALLCASLPATAADMGTGDTGTSVEAVKRAPFKVANRFHHNNVTAERAEFARLEIAEDTLGDSRRRPLHKSGNRFHGRD